MLSCWPGKNRRKWFKKIVQNPALYIEERSNKILPEEHEPEIEAMRFFGTGAERAAIDILAIIDWAAEYVKISNHPVPVYRDKGTPPKKGGGSSYTVIKLPSSLEPKGQRPLSLPHSP